MKYSIKKSEINRIFHLKFNEIIVEDEIIELDQKCKNNEPLSIRVDLKFHWEGEKLEVYIDNFEVEDVYCNLIELSYKEEKDLQNELIDYLKN